MDANVVVPVVVVGVHGTRVAVLGHNGRVHHFGRAHFVQSAQNADVAIDDE